MKKLGLLVRLGLAAVIATAGGVMVAFVPHTIHGYERDRQDLMRARAPLLKNAAADLKLDTELKFAISIPTDAQWQRITKRLGSPGFLLVIATAPEAIHTETFPAPEFVSSVEVTQAGRTLTLTLTRDVPERYSATSAANAFTFANSEPSPL